MNEFHPHNSERRHPGGRQWLKRASPANNWRSS
jgi:hypothetical protein